MLAKYKVVEALFINLHNKLQNKKEGPIFLKRLINPPITITVKQYFISSVTFLIVAKKNFMKKNL